MKASYLLVLLVSAFSLILGAPQYEYQTPRYLYSAPEEHVPAPDTLYATPEESVPAPDSLYATPEESVDVPSTLYDTPEEHMTDDDGPINLNPSYSTSYIVSDASTQDEKQAEETLEDGITVGSYQYVRPDGILQIVRYTVTSEGGFQAVVEEKPGYAEPITQKSTSRMPLEEPKLVYETPEPEGLYVPPKPKTVYIAPTPDPKPQETYIPPMQEPKTVYIAPKPEPLHVDQLYVAPKPKIQKPNQLYSTPGEEDHGSVSAEDDSNEDIVRVSSAHFAPNPFLAPKPSARVVPLLQIPQSPSTHHLQTFPVGGLPSSFLRLSPPSASSAPSSVSSEVSPINTISAFLPATASAPVHVPAVLAVPQFHIQRQNKEVSSAAIVTFSSPSHSYSYLSHE